MGKLRAVLFHLGGLGNPRGAMGMAVCDLGVRVAFPSPQGVTRSLPLLASSCREGRRASEGAACRKASLIPTLSLESVS